ncbi:MAG: DUF5615 family PIN-like protein [Cyanobacteria bacterium P01_E01_bin.42]
MSIKYLIDENLSSLYKEQLSSYLPDRAILKIGDPDVPCEGTLDPEILIWCEANDFILVTNNRSSMPIHLAEHLTQDRHIPGIFVLRRKFTIGQILNELVLIAQAGDPEEYRDRISYIPL